MTDVSPTLALIDGAIDDWTSNDAMRWRPEPDERSEVGDEPVTVHLDNRDARFIRSDLDSHGRPRYERLTGHQRQALHEWCQLHGVDHTRVPIDPDIELDPTIGEWVIEVLHLRDGKAHLDGDQIAMVTLRRAFKAELPWPEVAP